MSRTKGIVQNMFQAHHSGFFFFAEVIDKKNSGNCNGKFWAEPHPEYHLC